MGKQQDWSVAACVFLFLSLTSQINSAYASKRGISSVNVPSPPKTGVNQKELDLIQSLPGQPPVSFKQYGGYVAINETAGRYFYYYFVEAVKANASTPLVVYLEGGPMCSSLSGALGMFGPFGVNSDRLFLNPYAWNNEVNILYIESPATVGFSYTKTQSDVDNQGDKMTAEDNYTFLVNWFERFPEYKGRDFYITGESYAGHYVPQLSQIILQRNKKTVINLRGIFLGNPLLDRPTEESVKNEYLLGHSLISQADFDEEKTFCVNPTSAKCSRARDNIYGLIEDLGLYNIYATSCSHFMKKRKSEEPTTPMEHDPCRGKYMASYLSTDEVQAAMHANATKLQYGWSVCVGGQFKDTDTMAPMQPILHELMSKGIRIWVYNGDLDVIVSTTATQAVVKSMKLTVERRWRVWFSDGEVGGYTEEYKGNFVYATVRGAGHNVATDQPQRALTLFTNFIRNTALPGPPPPGPREMIIN